MLHTRIVDIKNNKILIDEAEKFISSSKFGASIFFKGPERNINEKKNLTKLINFLRSHFIPI